MANTLKASPFSERDLFYRRQRYKNRMFSRIANLFAEEAARSGITKHDLSVWLDRDPAQVTRWLNAPSNLTLETVSDILLALGAEEDPTITRFSDKPLVNYMHPLIELSVGRIVGAKPPSPPAAQSGVIVNGPSVEQQTKSGSSSTHITGIQVAGSHA